MNTIGIEEPEVCFRDEEHGRSPAGVASRFSRQSDLWDRLTSLAGYPAAFRDLFARLRAAGMLPEGTHRVLDAGAGTAALSRAYAQVVGRSAQVTTLDRSPRMLARARRQWSRDLSPLTQVVGDVANTGFPREQFEVVMSAHCLEHTPDPVASLREMTRVLRPGGLLLIVTGRSGVLNTVTSRIWTYARVDSCDLLRWMWENGAAPVGRVRLGPSLSIGHWRSEAVLGRKAARD